MDRSEALSILRITSSAARDPLALRRAYRTRLREAHPDLNPLADAAQLTAAVLAAYRTLAAEPVAPADRPGNRRPSTSPPTTGAGRRGRPAVRVLDDSSLMVGEDRQTTFEALLRASRAIGEIGYVDRSAWLLEVVVEFEEAPTSSIVMTLQGRPTGTEVFCTVEPLSGGEFPPVGPVTELIARTVAGIDRAGPG